MTLGFCSAILPDHDLSGVLEVAAGIGYDCVEVMCWPVGKSERRYAGVTHIDLDQFEGESSNQIQSLPYRFLFLDRYSKVH